jgi:hypothetical protein
VLGKREVDLGPALYALRVDLGHIGVDAQRLNCLHVKQLVGRAWSINCPVSTLRAVTTPSKGA